MVRVRRWSCEAQCGNKFQGCKVLPARQMQKKGCDSLLGVCLNVWVDVCIYPTDEKREDDHEMKTFPYSHIDSEQNNTVLWHRLYLPLFLASSPLPPSSPHLSFDQCPFFFADIAPSMASHTWNYVCACVFLHLFFLTSFPWYHIDFDLHHRLAQPFPLSCCSFAICHSSYLMHLLALLYSSVPLGFIHWFPLRVSLQKKHIFT